MDDAKSVGDFDTLASAGWSFTNASAYAAQFVIVQGVPDGPQLEVAAKLTVVEVLSGGWIKDREGPFGKEGQWVQAASGGHGGDSL